MRKFELSILIAAVVTIVWCAVSPGLTTQWWTTAFSPLCDGILSAGAEGGDVVLRSRLLELLTQLGA